MEISSDLIWVLQYPKRISEANLIERNIILNALSKQNISYVDTFDIFHASEIDTDRFYGVGHHTAEGNNLVCNEIAANL